MDEYDKVQEFPDADVTFDPFKLGDNIDKAISIKSDGSIELMSAEQQKIDYATLYNRMQQKSYRKEISEE